MRIMNDNNSDCSASVMEKLRSALLHIGRRGPEWPIPDCLPIEKCFSRDIANELDRRSLVAWDGHGFCLTDKGQAIFDKLVTGQPVPDEWWS